MTDYGGCEYGDVVAEEPAEELTHDFIPPDCNELSEEEDFLEKSFGLLDDRQ